MRLVPPLLILALPAYADAPYQYLATAGKPGDGITPLLWALLGVSILVVLLIAGLVLFGLRRVRGGVDPAADRASVHRADERQAMRWIYGGLLLTTVVLLGFTGWTVRALNAMIAPAPALSLEVTALQWWWEIRYNDPEDPDRSFVTANEIHIPVGQPVSLRLRSADVIHSFWVPALGGKTDLIPGQENMTWLQADTPGVWEGRCVEYCGLQHANMALRVIADPPEAFNAWIEQERRPAAAPETELQRQGRTVFLQTCGACHRVRGTPARGRVGPDLTHLMSRSTLAGGILPNTPEQLTAWITDPQALKPGAHMPPPHLAEDELTALLAWLGTLE